MTLNEELQKSKVAIREAWKPLLDALTTAGELRAVLMRTPDSIYCNFAVEVEEKLKDAVSALERSDVVSRRSR